MKWVSFIPTQLRRTVIRAAQLDSEPVYLSGETGSGKSAIARWIHQNSPRSTKPFVLFEKGESLSERIEEASDGTLVLLEVGGYTPVELSAVLRLVRSHSFSDPRRNGLRTLVRARIIVTGESPISEFSPFDSVIKDFRVHLPALSDRGKEFDDIVGNLLEEMAHELKRDHVREISSAALAALQKHTWRANLRELRNILRYGILHADSGKIELSDLPNLRDPDRILTRNREEFAEIERALIDHPRTTAP